MKPRWLLLLVSWMGACALVSGADNLKPSETKTAEALHAVISGQLVAFRDGDYAAAYGFADEQIKTQFSVERFEQMVKGGYPAIAHSTSATFGLTLDNGDEALVNVRVIGPDKQPGSFQYMLRRVGEVWRITGVVPLKDRTTEV